VGVDEDDPVDAVGREIPGQTLDVVAKRSRVGPHRPVELLVVGADADVYRRRTEEPGLLGGSPGERLGDDVVGPLGEVGAVLFG